MTGATSYPWSITDDTGSMYELKWDGDDGWSVMIYKAQYAALEVIAPIVGSEALTRAFVVGFINGDWLEEPDDVTIEHGPVAAILNYHKEIQSRFVGRHMPDGYMMPTALIDDLAEAYGRAAPP